MIDVLLPVARWYLVLAIIGWLAFPLAYRLFSPLGDRGLSLARPLGLLLAGYMFWLGGLVGALPNAFGGALFAVLLLGALGFWALQGVRDELADFVRTRWRRVVAIEGVFLLALVAWGLYRSAYPNIESAGGEKYMEMAFVNAILESPTFPPNDPWMSGLSISYYYFGYLMGALLIHLSGVLPTVGFNLVVPTSFAMVVAGGAGMGYNLAALAGRASAVERAVAGGLTALMIPIFGNLEGFLELLYMNGVGPPGFWNWLNIKNLTVAGSGVPPEVCLEGSQDYGLGSLDDGIAFVPRRFIWWWRASRVVHDGCGTEIIHEFPFFSYLLGDAHPHVMAIPFLILVAGLALAVLAGPLRPSDDDVATGMFLYRPRWLILPIAVGALGFLNAWDLPTALGLVVLTFGFAVWRRPARFSATSRDLLIGSVGAAGAAFVIWTVAGPLAARAGEQTMLVRTVVSLAGVLGLAAIVEALRSMSERGTDWASRLLAIGRFAVWLAVLSLVLYLPFYVVLQSQVEGIGVVGTRSRVSQWLVHFGAPVFFAGTVALAGAAHLWRRRREHQRLRPLTTGVLAVALAAGMAALVLSAWTALGLIAMVAAATAGAIEVWIGRPDDASPAALEAEPSSNTAKPEPPEPSSGASAPFGGPAPISTLEPRSALTFALLCAAVGFALPLLVEFVFVRDLFNNRMNSVFKFYYQGWVLLGLAGGFSVVVVRERLESWTGAAWTAGAIALIAASLVYPLAAVSTRTDGACLPGTYARAAETGASDCVRPLSLDGLRWWEASHPDDLAAARWLRESVPGTPVIVEASGGSYGHPGRMSMATGYPTVLGWDFHEAQWGRTWEEDITPRKTDVETIYKTSNSGEMLDLLARYGVEYLVFGPTEMDAYGLGDSARDRFATVLTPVFESGRVSVFSVPPRKEDA